MKAGVYCRLSEEDRNKAAPEDESLSIQNQKAMLLEYAAERGWEIYDVYSDDDYAGADRRRPEFNRLLRDAEARRFEIVLCKTQSRFTRELELVEKYIHGLFPAWGIRFVSIVDNADTANKGNKKSRQINGLVNEWYLEDMSENIKSVLTSRRRAGLHIGSFALYGYKKDPDRRGHLIIDPEAAAVVREVFTLFADGYGKTAIARILNERGIPNPTEYKRRQGLNYRQPQNSTLWKYFSIADMLKNEIYLGNMVQGKYGSVSYKTKRNRPRPADEWYIVEGTHEPIIERELWERVQRIAAERAKPFAGGMVGLFAGKARCAECGYVLRSCASRGRRYLQCPNRVVSKESCAGAFIAVARLEGQVSEELRRLTSEYIDAAELCKDVDISGTLQRERENLSGDIAQYNARAEEYSRYLRELYTDKVRGIVSECDYMELAAQFSAERERAAASAADAAARVSEIEEQIAAADTRGTVERILTPERLSRALVETFVDYIDVGRRVAGTREVPIVIHWAF